LGIPVDTKLVLDDRELEALRVEHPQINAEDAVQVGLAARLDYWNARDQYDDAVRRVDLAANFLKPQLDLVANVGIRSPPDQRAGFPVPDIDRYNWSAGLDVDLPLDRKAERNSYRGALIFEKRAARALEQQADEIRLEVRESWRALDQAKRNYEISELGVQIAERRVEEQDLLAEVGRAKAQDQVDAQNDLITSKNQLTQALVSHTIARLQFWSNMGILYIKENGQWRELNDSDVLQNP
jgi:outer membrane protein TolC